MSLDYLKRLNERYENWISGYKEGRKPNRVNLNAIIGGSEGTLVVISELKLKLTPLPKYKLLLVLQYDAFHHALAHAQALIIHKPAAIETMNETILELAKTDVIYGKVKRYVSHDNYQTQGVNLIEFVGDDKAVLENKVTALIETINFDHDHCFNYKIANTDEAIADIWTLRKKSVGLLGKIKGKRKPTSGMEDTVVPPEKLADFIAEFRVLLDKHQLQYGMFGHVDAGCLHVRPALDLSDPKDEALYHELSDQINQLTKRYGGLMWGEHGKGYRSEYTPMFFGDELYLELEKIKRSFDPRNRLNPGKIAVPFGSDATLVKVTSEKRGSFDRQINEDLRAVRPTPEHP